MKRCETQDETIKKRLADYATFQKWQHESGREYQTVSWLSCNSAKRSGKTVVTQLKCRICEEIQVKES